MKGSKYGDGPEHRVNRKTGCWIWRKGLDKDGYGFAWYKGKHVRAHRKYYTLYKGEIPEGKHLDHLCKNRRCVNPDHLEAVSPKVNLRRSKRTKLTPDQVVEIRRRRNAGERVAVLAKEFKVCDDNIYAIMGTGKLKSWTTLEI